MNPVANIPHVKAEELEIKRLASNDSLSDSDKVSELAVRFQSILVKEIMNAVYKPLLGDGLIPSEGVNKFYKDMVLDQLTETISRSGDLSLASLMESEFGSKDDSEDQLMEMKSEKRDGNLKPGKDA